MLHIPSFYSSNCTYYLVLKLITALLFIAMIDIDNFKSVNDKYGHLAGDYILKEVSKIFINTLRKTDFVYRYGGEKNCILKSGNLVEKSL